MKRILLSFLFVVFVLNTVAQQYTPMLELGKIWNMHHFDNFIPPNNVDFNISLDNMVTINGVAYFEASNGNFFREDITNKKVYRLNNGVEELILDFDLNLGDDLLSPLLFIDETTFSREITEIGTNTFYGIPNLKYYRTDCGEQIIEGIGVTSVGLFGFSYFCTVVDFDEGDYLINMNQPFILTEYVPMLYEGKIWNMNFHWEDWVGPPPNTGGYIDFDYYIEGKTVINGIEYFNLKSTNESYVYYLREDVENKIVYWISFDGEEVILFNFNVNIGEIFHNYFIDNIIGIDFIVSNIGFIDIFGIQTKYYELEDQCDWTDNYIIYEGIGFLPEGLLNEPISNDCFFVDQLNFYEVVNMNQPLLINDFFAQNSIKLFYNFNAKQLQLTNNAKDVVIEIYSVLGKKVIVEQINTSINVSQLPKGVYFYNLLKDNVTKKGKILIY